MEPISPRGPLQRKVRATEPERIAAGAKVPLLTSTGLRRKRELSKENPLADSHCATGGAANEDSARNAVWWGSGLSTAQRTGND